MILCVAALVYSKYISFLTQTINQITNSSISFPDIAVTIGLSFTTFEVISYIIDIYRKDATPGNLLDVATFLLLFPKLVSGPIVLWKDFQPQLRVQCQTANDAIAGIDRIIIGYAKKAIIADSLGSQISLIDQEIASYGIDSPTMWLKALCYFFQIYYDFSGYSDIAIGMCKVMGFNLKENFNFPYTSTSVSEFWRKWHISLGTWFREYVYIPLGGNRKGNVYLNLFVVFLLTGIWHGANWTFILWGIIHGIAVMIEKCVQNKGWYAKIPAWLKWAVTVTFVYFTWILFASDDIPGAINSYRLLFLGMQNQTLNFTWEYYLTRKTIILLLIAGLGSVASAIKMPERVKKWLLGNWQISTYRIALLGLLVLDVMFVVNSTYSPFIYFQF